MHYLRFVDFRFLNSVAKDISPAVDDDFRIKVSVQVFSKMRNENGGRERGKTYLVLENEKKD